MKEKKTLKHTQITLLNISDYLLIKAPVTLADNLKTAATLEHGQNFTHLKCIEHGHFFRAHV